MMSVCRGPFALGIYKLSAIETRHGYIVNTYKVYNNKNSNELRTYMSGSRGGGLQGYQYYQSSQLKLKNRRLKSNNKSNKSLLFVIIIIIIIIIITQQRK